MYRLFEYIQIFVKKTHTSILNLVCWLVLLELNKFWSKNQAVFIGKISEEIKGI